MFDSSQQLVRSSHLRFAGIGFYALAGLAPKIIRTLLVMAFVSHIFGLQVTAQNLFREPQIPNLRTIGDRAVGTRNGNRLGLSPHLTSAQAVDIGVPQTGDQLPSEALTRKNEASQSAVPLVPEGHDPADVEPLPAFSQGELSELETIEGVELEANDATGSQTGNPVGDLGHRQSSSQNAADTPRFQAQRPPSGREIIVQRYPDGKPQIEREVVQDEHGNFVNDGFWRVLARKGEKNVIASGRYQMGVMHGVWQRQHTAESSGLFATQPFSQFESPFLSMATFDNGQLDGMWTLSDAYERKIFEIPYRKGQRHGTATWWLPVMTKMREVTFKDGLLDGHLLEWDEKSKLTRDEEFVDGKKIIRNVTYYRPKQKESENFFLDAKLKVDGTDNWWDARPAPLVAEGKRLQHGPAVAWYDNGLPKMKGQYADGLRIGRFTWWYSNGNKQLEGAYENDKKVGPWTWWHENGMQAIGGQYEADQSVGVWRWWNTEGQLESDEDLSRAPAVDRSGSANSSADTPPFKAELKLDQPSSKKTGQPEKPDVLPEGLPEAISPLEAEPATESDADSPADSVPSLNLEDFEGANPLEDQSQNPVNLEMNQIPDNFFSDD